MSILAKDTEVGKVYVSQNNNDVLIKEKYDDRIVGVILKSGAVRDDIQPDYEFLREKPMAATPAEGAAPQNADQNVPGVVARPNPETAEPAEVLQENAGVEPGKVVNHNPRVPLKTAVVTPHVRTSKAPAPVSVAPAPVPTTPPPAKVAKAPVAPKTDLDPEEQALLDQKKALDAKLKDIRTKKATDARVNNPNLFGIRKLDKDTAMCQRMRENGVSIKELTEKIGQVTLDRLCTKAWKAAKSGEWVEFSVSNGLIKIKKTK